MFSRFDKLLRDTYTSDPMDPVVELRSGLARGVVEKHEDGFDYFAFKGIPYGEAPVGELRFKDPVAIKKWTGIRDCKAYGPVCLQYDVFFKLHGNSEDCLHLNVYSHSINDDNVSNPVIVYIHGGGYLCGSVTDAMCGPDYFIRKNIVLVTVTYRLGVLGFLNLEDEVAPGNQGHKDLLLALQWIQQNIRVLGGDPGNVTVLGFSAGGVLAHYLALSPLSKGLIHKIILQSSSIYTTWAHVTNPKSFAMKLCSALGRDLTDSKEILDFLRTVDAAPFAEFQTDSWLVSKVLPFGPGTDSKSATPVMPVSIEVAASQGLHIPCIMGYNSHEAEIVKRMSLAQGFEMFDRDFGTALGFNAKEVLSRYQFNEKQVKKFYYKNDTISEKNADTFCDFFNDFVLNEGIHRLAAIQAERSSASTYFYLFSYNPPELMSKIMLNTDLSGPAHFDDLPFLFKMNVLESLGGTHLKKGTRSYKMMEQMTEMYANFARHGRPTIGTNELIPVHWRPLNDGTVIRYLDLDEDITMRSMLNLDEKLSSIKYIKV